MTISAEIIQVLYEIAIAIGSRLDLKQMLRKSLSAFVRKLTCFAGGVIFLRDDSNGLKSLDAVSTIPRNLSGNVTYRAVLAAIPHPATEEELQKFNQSLPLVAEGEPGNFYHLLELPLLGYLVLLKSDSPLDQFILNSLSVLLSKLSYSCLTCQQNEELASARDELENRVMQRTAELSNANRQLKKEIEDRIAAQRKIESQQAQLISIFDSINEPIYVADIETYRILYANRAITEMFGKDLIGGVCYRKLQNRENPCPFCTNEIILWNQGRPYQWEYHNPILDRDYMIVDKIISWPDGRDVRFEIAMDMTDRKRMEYDLHQTQKLESLGVLAGGIAHDFNNCLAVILGNLSFTRSMLPEGSEGFEALSDAESSCTQAKNLTRQLLTFARGGKPVKRITTVSILLADSIRFALSGSNCNCKAEIAEDLRPAKIDSGQIQQVFNNLLLNAVQAMPEGGEIEVRADNIMLPPDDISSLPEGPYLKIVISDQGFGISPADLPRIFDPYFSSKSKGHGLGLATSHAIISNHNGSITAQSGPEGGAAFTVLLAASNDAAPPRADSDNFLVRGEGRILLMDDEDLVLKAVSKMCRSLGYEIVAAPDGKKAINIYRTSLEEGRPFDAVILDLTVPGGLGGKEVVRELIKLNPDVRAIASSGYSNDPVMSDYSACGFAAVIQKPYNLPEFSRILNSVLKD